MHICRNHVDDHVLFCTCTCVQCTFVPTMLAELLYPLQDGDTPLHLAARGGHITCVEHLLATPGIDVHVDNAFEKHLMY